jgi:hypothetical protein
MSLLDHTLFLVQQVARLRAEVRLLCGDVDGSIH